MTLSVLDAIEDHRLFEQQNRLVRLAPFAISYAAALALFPFGADARYGGWLLGAALAAVATLAAAALVPWERIPAPLQLTPLLLYLASIAMVREAHGGVASGYAPLVLVAVVWAAVFADWTVLAVVVLAAGATIMLPAVIAGAPGYPAGEYRRGALVIFVAAVAGTIIHVLIRSLVEEVHRREAAESRLTRLRAEGIHDDLVQAFAVAQLALRVGDGDTALEAVTGGLTAAQALTAEMLAESQATVEPGALRRTAGTTLGHAHDPAAP